MGIVTRSLGMAIAAWLTLAGPVAGQLPSQPCSVLGSAGGWGVEGGRSNISAVAQPGGVQVSTGPGLRNYAGFLGGFVLAGDRDADGDGLADELDGDNDNDGLEDAAELAGSAFNPVTRTDANQPDTDGDGATDGMEAVAGTDPTDKLSHLHFVRIVDEGSGTRLAWRARGGNTYVLQSGDSLVPDTFTQLTTTNAVGGLPPWYVVTNEFVDSTFDPAGIRFYRVETTK